LNSSPQICGALANPMSTGSTLLDYGETAVGTRLANICLDPTLIPSPSNLLLKPSVTHRGVGVRETSRLISRLRHRQFGVLVTTSHLDSQAYREIREDGHPVVVLAGRDIVDRLKAQGLDNTTALRRYLLETYPPGVRSGALGG
jgi:hypothetical protein